MAVVTAILTATQEAEAVTNRVDDNHSYLINLRLKNTKK